MTKPTKWHARAAKTQTSLSIHPVWSESSLSAWRNLMSLATHWVHSEDSDAQADSSLRWVHMPFVRFVMRRLICKQQRLWPDLSQFTHSICGIRGSIKEPYLWLHWMYVHVHLNDHVTTVPFLPTQFIYFSEKNQDLCLLQHIWANFTNEKSLEKH